MGKRYFFKLYLLNEGMWPVKLIPKDGKIIACRASEFSSNGGGRARMDVAGFEPGEERQRLSICDLIQAEMNEGYSLGRILAREGGEIELEDVYSDGSTVCFGRDRRPADWIPAERLRKFILDNPKTDYGYLKTIAERCGYLVKLVK